MEWCRCWVVASPTPKSRIILRLMPTGSVAVGAIPQSIARDSELYTDADISGSESAFSGWDKNISDDYSSSDFNTDFATKSTDDLTEGSSNLYFTDERAENAIANVLTAGANINLMYSNSSDSLKITSSYTDTNTTYTEGNGINISGSNVISSTLGTSVDGGELRANSVGKSELKSGYQSGNAYDSRFVNESDKYTDADISGVDITEDTNLSVGSELNLSGGDTLTIGGSITRDAEIDQFITDGNQGWNNTYGFITDGNQGWNNIYGFITEADDSIGADTQDLSYNKNTDVISLIRGGTIDISEVDTDTNTDTQNLSYSSGPDVIHLARGGDIDISSVDTIDENENNEDQTLSINGDKLSIASGNTITINDANTTYGAGSGINISGNTVSVESDVSQLGGSISNGEVANNLTINGNGSVSNGALSGAVSLWWQYLRL